MNLNHKTPKKPSKYMITAMDKHGNKRTLCPRGWEAHTGVDRNTIRHRYMREMDARLHDENRINRPMEQVVGVEYYERDWDRCEARNVKVIHKPVDPIDERAKFLYGRTHAPQS